MRIRWACPAAASNAARAWLSRRRANRCWLWPRSSKLLSPDESPPKVSTFPSGVVTDDECYTNSPVYEVSTLDPTARRLGPATAVGVVQLMA